MRRLLKRVYKTANRITKSGSRSASPMLTLQAVSSSHSSDTNGSADDSQDARAVEPDENEDISSGASARRKTARAAGTIKSRSSSKQQIETERKNFTPVEDVLCGLPTNQSSVLESMLSSVESNLSKAESCYSRGDNKPSRSERKRSKKGSDGAQQATMITTSTCTLSHAESKQSSSRRKISNVDRQKPTVDFKDSAQHEPRYSTDDAESIINDLKDLESVSDLAYCRSSKSFVSLPPKKRVVENLTKGEVKLAGSQEFFSTVMETCNEEALESPSLYTSKAITNKSCKMAGAECESEKNGLSFVKNTVAQSDHGIREEFAKENEPHAGGGELQKKAKVELQRKTDVVENDVFKSFTNALSRAFSIDNANKRMDNHPIRNLQKSKNPEQQSSRLVLEGSNNPIKMDEVAMKFSSNVGTNSAEFFTDAKITAAENHSLFAQEAKFKCACPSGEILQSNYLNDSSPRLNEEDNLLLLIEEDEDVNPVNESSKLDTSERNNKVVLPKIALSKIWSRPLIGLIRTRKKKPKEEESNAELILSIHGSENGSIVFESPALPFEEDRGAEKVSVDFVEEEPVENNNMNSSFEGEQKQNSETVASILEAAHSSLQSGSMLRASSSHCGKQGTACKTWTTQSKPMPQANFVISRGNSEGQNRRDSNQNLSGAKSENTLQIDTLTVDSIPTNTQGDNPDASQHNPQHPLLQLEVDPSPTVDEGSCILSPCLSAGILENESEEPGGRRNKSFAKSISKFFSKAFASLDNYEKLESPKKAPRIDPSLKPTPELNESGFEVLWGDFDVFRCAQAGGMEHIEDGIYFNDGTANEEEIIFTTMTDGGEEDETTFEPDYSDHAPILSPMLRHTAKMSAPQPDCDEASDQTNQFADNIPEAVKAGKSDSSSHNSAEANDEAQLGHIPVSAVVKKFESKLSANARLSKQSSTTARTEASECVASKLATAKVNGIGLKKDNFNTSSKVNGIGPKKDNFNITTEQRTERGNFCKELAEENLPQSEQKCVSVLENISANSEQISIVRAQAANEQRNSSQITALNNNTVDVRPSPADSVSSKASYLSARSRFTNACVDKEADASTDQKQECVKSQRTLTGTPQRSMKVHPSNPKEDSVDERASIAFTIEAKASQISISSQASFKSCRSSPHRSLSYSASSNSCTRQIPVNQLNDDQTQLTGNDKTAKALELKKCPSYHARKTRDNEAFQFTSRARRQVRLNGEGIVVYNMLGSTTCEDRDDASTPANVNTPDEALIIGKSQPLTSSVSPPECSVQSTRNALENEKSVNIVPLRPTKSGSTKTDVNPSNHRISVTLEAKQKAQEKVKASVKKFSGRLTLSPAIETKLAEIERRVDPPPPSSPAASESKSVHTTPPVRSRISRLSDRSSTASFSSRRSNFRHRTSSSSPQKRSVRKLVDDADEALECKPTPSGKRELIISSSSPSSSSLPPSSNDNVESDTRRVGAIKSSNE